MHALTTTIIDAQKKMLRLLSERRNKLMTIAIIQKSIKERVTKAPVIV